MPQADHESTLLIDGDGEPPLSSQDEIWHSDDFLELDEVTEINRCGDRKLSLSNSGNVNASAASALLISASDKAGMAGIDRQRINAIMMRESGNSSFMQKQRQMDENTNRKIEEMKQRLIEKDNIVSHDSRGRGMIQTSIDNLKNLSNPVKKSPGKYRRRDWRKEREECEIDPVLEACKSRRCPISTCVVIDMDGFFISCHILSHPSLAEVPACVGGQSMISTSNYAARRYGVRAAMPGYIGSALVKELSGGKETLRFVKHDFDLYKRKSGEARKVLEEYDPHLRMYSLDEVYLNIGPYLNLCLTKGESRTHDEIRDILARSCVLGTNVSYCQENYYSPVNLSDHFHPRIIHETAQKILHSIRKKVRDKTGLTCSAGLASNFLLSKIASDINKPNGQCFVGPSEKEISEFINPLPIRKVNGIGRVMEKILQKVCSIETVNDLYQKRAEIEFLFKPTTAKFLLNASIGFSERLLSPTKETGGSLHKTGTKISGTDEEVRRKGISHERTFPPTSSWTDLCSKLESIALSLLHDLKEKDLKPRIIALKVKLANFDVLTKATKRDLPLSYDHHHGCRDMVEIVVNLLKETKRAYTTGRNGGKLSTSVSKGTNFSVRLLGVRCSNFQSEKEIQSLLYSFCTARHPANDNNSVSPPKTQIVGRRQKLGLIKDDKSDDNASPNKNPYMSPAKTSLPEASLAKPSANNRQIASHELSSPSSGTPENKAKPNNVPQSETNNPFIQCPICSRRYQSDKYNNAEINEHIDACLNASTIRQLTRDRFAHTGSELERMHKKRRLTNYFST